MLSVLRQVNRRVAKVGVARPRDSGREVAPRGVGPRALFARVARAPKLGARARAAALAVHEPRVDRALAAGRPLGAARLVVQVGVARAAAAARRRRACAAAKVVPTAGGRVARRQLARAEAVAVRAEAGVAVGGQNCWFGPPWHQYAPSAARPPPELTSKRSRQVTVSLASCTWRVSGSYAQSSAASAGAHASTISVTRLRPAYFRQRPAPSCKRKATCSDGARGATKLSGRSANKFSSIACADP